MRGRVANALPLNPKQLAQSAADPSSLRHAREGSGPSTQCCARQATGGIP